MLCKEDRQRSTKCCSKTGSKTEEAHRQRFYYCESILLYRKYPGNLTIIFQGSRSLAKLLSLIKEITFIISVRCICFKIHSSTMDMELKMKLKWVEVSVALYVKTPAIKRE